MEKNNYFSCFFNVQVLDLPVSQFYWQKKEEYLSSVPYPSSSLGWLEIFSGRLWDHFKIIWEAALKTTKGEL